MYKSNIALYCNSMEIYKKSSKLDEIDLQFFVNLISLFNK